MPGVVLMERSHERFPHNPFLQFVQPPPATGGIPVPMVQETDRSVTGERRKARADAHDRGFLVTLPAASHAGAAETEALQQYGALPWRNDSRRGMQVLLITSRTSGRWIVPKGWPMDDRASYLAAALEAFEEAGVIGEIQTSPLGDYHYMKTRKDSAPELCRVTLFALRVLGSLRNWPEKGQRQRRWLSLPEASHRVGDAGLARIIRAVDRAPETLLPDERLARQQSTDLV